MQSEQIDELLAAKAKVMEAVPYIRKKEFPDGAKTQYKSFHSEREYLIRLRPALAANNIHFAPVAAEHVHSTTMVVGQYKNTYMVRCFMITYRFTHLPSQQYQDVVVLGEGADAMDKAAPKCMTAAQKYALRQWLYVETGDDPEAIATIDGEHLSEVASTVLTMVLQASSREDLATISKRVAASANLPGSERAYLIDAIEAKRDEMFSLDDIEE